MWTCADQSGVGVVDGAYFEIERQPEVLADDAHHLGVAQVGVLIGTSCPGSRRQEHSASTLMHFGQVQPLSWSDCIICTKQVPTDA